MVPEKTEQPEKYQFPLDIMHLPQGFVVVVRHPNGRATQLLKPGWSEEANSPYLFQSPEQAWYFLRKLFLFCIKLQHTQFEGSDKIMNCDQCGRVIRAKFFQTCVECLKDSEFKLTQIWQGFYYMTGSHPDAAHKMALMLKIPLDKFELVPEAFRSLFTECQDFHQTLEAKQKSEPPPQFLPMKAASGMRSSRSHRVQL